MPVILRCVRCRVCEGPRADAYRPAHSFPRPRLTRCRLQDVFGRREAPGAPRAPHLQPGHRHPVQLAGDGPAPAQGARGRRPQEEEPQVEEGQQAVDLRRRQAQHLLPHELRAHGSRRLRPGVRGVHGESECALLSVRVGACFPLSFINLSVLLQAATQSK